MHNIAHVHIGYKTMRDLVKAMKALSDETRLRTLSLLLERECCVCEMMRALDISQSKASRSLSALYDAGFLRLRRDGTWAFYSIDETKEFYPELIGGVRKALEGNKIVEADRDRLRKAERLGPGCAQSVKNDPSRQLSANSLI